VLDLLFLGAQVLGDLGIHPRKSEISPIDIGQLVAQQKAMGGLPLTLEGLREQVTFGAHPAACQFS